MATQPAQSKMPKADLCLRTNDEGMPELYVTTEKGEFLVAGTMDVDLDPVQHRLLTATIKARIMRLG